MADKRTLLITGSNTGLGLEAVKAFLQSPQLYTIIMGGRSLDKVNAAIKSLKEEYPQTKSDLDAVQVDVESDDSINKCFEEVSKKYDHIDSLINNAGASFDGEIRAGRMTTREGWNKAWDVNVTGTYIMTHTFVPLLLKSKEPRLLFITSGTSPLADTENLELRLSQAPPKGWPKPNTALAITSYRSTKTGMNMMMREWARILREDGVKVFAVSPGMLATGLGGVGPEALKKMGAEEPWVGGHFIKDVVEGKRDEHVGKAVRRSGIQPW